jgi:hypothetical protein
MYKNNLTITGRMLAVIPGLILIPILIPSIIYGQTSSVVPPLSSSTIMEYSEQSGGIVHINFTAKNENNDSPSDIANLRELIRETITQTTPKVTVASPVEPTVAQNTSTTDVIQSVTVKLKPETTTRSTQIRKVRAESSPTVVKPKPIDYTIIPDKDNRIKCPGKTCGVWNNVMESACRYCGVPLRNSPQIVSAREQILLKQDEERRRLLAEQAMYAAKPKVDEPEENVPAKPAGPEYEKYRLQIEQLGTAYNSLAETKLLRDGIKCLPDLTLALKDPNANIQANVKGMLPKLVNEVNANDFALALREPSTRDGAEVALKRCGYVAANALFLELKANNASSAPSVVRAIGPLGAKAVPLVEQHLTPELVPVYPRLADVLLEIGSPSFPLLLRQLTDTEDEYILQFACGALVRFKDKAVKPLEEALEAEARWDRKKRIIECLGQVGSSEAIPTLLNFVKTERFGIYLAARNSLAEIGSRESLIELGKLFGTGSTELVETTLDMLVKSKGPAVVALGELSKDESSRVRRFAVQGLGTLLSSHPEARPLLEAALKDADRGVRNQAQTSLGQ